MGNDYNLLRMIILTSFVILLLIFYSYKLNKKIYKYDKDLYNKTISWQYKDESHQLLLHSIKLDLISFTAYSFLTDTITRFPALNQDMNYIKNIYEKNNFLNLECISCHK